MCEIATKLEIISESWDSATALSLAEGPSSNNIRISFFDCGRKRNRRATGGY
jgi:hypothetical protein